MTAVARGDRRIAVRSGHGVGKTTVLAWLIVWSICARFPQRTVCTAPTSDQLFDALASETKKWITKLPELLQQVLEVQSEKIFLKAAPNESYVSFRTARPEKPEALAGVHADDGWVLLIGDEASGIPDAVFESASGSMSGHNCTTILAGNPVRSSGFFYQAFNGMADMWTTMHISCVNHPRVDPDFIEQIRKTYGERSNAYRVRVLGEFPLADDDTIIPFELVEAALHREVTPYFVQEIWGVDVARYGSDASALARRKGNTLVKPVEVKYKLGTMEVVGWVKHEWDVTLPSQRPSEILVDTIGIGAGVTDRLIELGLPARGINVSESPTIFDERYNNQRTELWFKGLDWFLAKDCNIKGDEALMGELIAQKYKFTSTGKLQALSKEEMKKDGVDSPNRADAFLLTLASDAVTAISGASTKSSWKQPLRRRIKGIV